MNSSCTHSVILVLCTVASLVATCFADQAVWSVASTLLPPGQLPGPTTATTKDSIYFYGANYNINKVNRSNGALLWSVNPFNGTNFYYFRPNIAASDSAVVVGNSTYFFRLDIHTGAIMWLNTFEFWMHTVEPFTGATKSNGPRAWLLAVAQPRKRLWCKRMASLETLGRSGFSTAHLASSPFPWGPTIAAPSATPCAMWHAPLGGIPLPWQHWST